MSRIEQVLKANHLRRVHVGGRKYRWRLKVDNQYFDLGPSELSLRDSKHYETMVLHALRKLCRDMAFEANVDVITPL